MVPSPPEFARHDPQGSRARTLAELLEDVCTPLETLRTIKTLAKSSDKREQCPLPAPVASVIYYLAITAAWLRHGTLISSLDLETLREGGRWALEQTWLNGATRATFETAMRSFDGIARGTDVKP